jgi:hypothetical protein
VLAVREEEGKRKEGEERRKGWKKERVEKMWNFF